MSLLQFNSRSDIISFKKDIFSKILGAMWFWIYVWISPVELITNVWNSWYISSLDIYKEYFTSYNSFSIPESPVFMTGFKISNISYQFLLKKFRNKIFPRYKKQCEKLPFFPVLSVLDHPKIKILHGFWPDTISTFLF